MEVEYTLCQIQVAQTSLALRTHRRESHDPRLRILHGGQEVRWELTNLVEGPRQTVTGTPRRDRLDFYFFLETLRRDRGQMPPPTALPDDLLRLHTTDSRGTERQGGLRVRMVQPNRRYRVQSAELVIGQTPTFRAVGDEPLLHLDVETTPPSMYGQARPEVHFGIQATFQTKQVPSGTYNYAVVSMTPEAYATIYEDIQAL